MSLREKHPMKHDEDFCFDPEKHLYTWKGRPIETSVTKMLGRYWQPFDAEAVIAEGFDRWAIQPTSKYFSLIKYLQLVKGESVEACKQAIAALWAADGKQASKKGTEMHAAFEKIIDGEGIVCETIETRLFCEWFQKFCDANELEPFRCELQMLHLADDGETPVVAGTADLVLRRKGTDEYVLIDFKRQDPTPKTRNGKPNLFGLNQQSIFCKPGIGPFETLLDSNESKYTMQLNAYAHILFHDYGMDAREHMFVVQVHEKMSEVHVTRIKRFDDMMRDVFALEEARALQAT